jgi:hypothetical protein
MRPQANSRQTAKNKANSSNEGSLAHRLPTDTCPADPDLAAVVAAWPGLPEAIRAGIVAMVNAAAGR